MASIKKVKNGTYIAQIALGINPQTGKRASTKKRGFRTQKEARLYAAEIERQVADGEYWREAKKDKKITYREAYEMWLKRYETKREPATVKKVKGLFDNHFLPKFGNIRLADITPLMVSDYALELSEKFVACALTYNRFIAPLNFAYNMELIGANPAEKVEKPRDHYSKGKSKAADFYEESELELFLEMSKRLSSKNYKQYAFFRLLAFSGARSQEVRAVSWDALNLEAHTLFIHRAISVSEEGEYIANRTKNKSSTRTISIDDETLNVLKIWKEIHRSKNPDWNENWLIFTNNRYDKNGQNFLSTSGIRKWRLKAQDLMDDAVGKKLKRIDIHGFRHTHVSLLLQNGVMPKAIAERVGHSDLTQINATYGHSTIIANDKLQHTLTTLLPSSRTKDELKQE